MLQVWQGKRIHHFIFLQKPLRRELRRTKKTLKLEFDYDDIKNLEKIGNPELKGTTSAKEYYEKVVKRSMESDIPWKDLNPIEKLRVKQTFNALGEGTQVIRGDVASKNIVGGQGYKKRTLGQVGKYIKNNPLRFAKEAGKVGLSLGAIGLAGKYGYDKAKRNRD